jgi:hypothetical protein|tara:strand:- start:93 stop:362 length:270 start_codon:yes stop_codon:yes gene_type:complete
MTDQIRIEDTLVDYMEIINGLNAKMNNHIQSTRVSLRDLEAATQQAPPGSYLSSGDPAATKLDSMKFSQQLIDYGTEIEKLRLDVLAQK